MWHARKVVAAEAEETDSDRETETSASELKHEKLAPLHEELARLDAEEAELKKTLMHLDDLWERRRRPLVLSIEELEAARDKVSTQLQVAMRAMEEEKPPEPPGPKSLRWVDSEIFVAVCNVVVILNLTEMFFGKYFGLRTGDFNGDCFDNAVLTWYLGEFALRLALHHCSLLFGPCGVVAWNWLDVLIILAGVLDQWLLPLFGADLGTGAMNVTVLRFLRLFRVLRFLKLVRTFLFSDLRWSQSPWFELLISSVVGVNSLVMALELDLSWHGWVWFENFFLIVYSFELLVRFKRLGCHFFIEQGSIFWNWLDVIMVFGGVVDLWAVPLAHVIHRELTGDAWPADADERMKNVMNLMRMARLMRVLRLVKLLRAVKPLYNLLLGVMESMRAMQWVLVLVMLLLYATAIIWTNLIGKDLLPTSGGEAKKSFGTVTASLFSLFKLMNGDTEVVAPVTSSLFGQLLFACFMVIANWAVLAILTSVVSDNMIRLSAQAATEDAELRSVSERQARKLRLESIFKEVDKDGSMAISEVEWRSLTQDKALLGDLVDATGLDAKSLEDIFENVSEFVSPDEHRSPITASSAQPSRPRCAAEGRILVYDRFIQVLDEGRSAADIRSVREVSLQVKSLEGWMLRLAEELTGIRRELCHRGQPTNCSYGGFETSVSTASFPRAPG